MDKVNYDPLVYTSSGKVPQDPDRHAIQLIKTYSTSEHYNGNATENAMISHSDYNDYVNTCEVLYVAAAAIGHKKFVRNPEYLLELHWKRFVILASRQACLAPSVSLYTREI